MSNGDDGSAIQQSAGSSIQQPAVEPVQEHSLAPEARQRLMQQFERWLDRMSAGEALPAGLPQELLAETDDAAPGAGRACDLYTLFSALTSLTGEIRLQGRAFKHLSDTLAPLSDIPWRLDRLEQSSERQPAGAGDLPASAKEICQALIDLYDRLARGLESCDHSIASLRRRGESRLRRWLGARWARQEAIASAEALRDAAALTLARLEAIFAQWGVERIGRLGESFDPQRMAILHVQPTSESEPGTVLEINRSGFALHGQVLATAQVTVARVESSMEQA